MAKKASKYDITYIWKDRKRFLGIPLSFTRYRMSEDRIFLESGFFSTKVEEILLYRVQDISLSMTLGDKIVGVGSITIQSSDKTMPTLVLKRIKDPRRIKEMLNRQVELMKLNYRVRVSELMGSEGQLSDSDSDGIPDYLDN
ncbi:MAG: PH domain-containing protein [Clostridia bacterium]|nr:PH domain-containing protein [Clostridia bacterium]